MDRNNLSISVAFFFFPGKIFVEAGSESFATVWAAILLLLLGPAVVVHKYSMNILGRGLFWLENQRAALTKREIFLAGSDVIRAY